MSASDKIFDHSIFDNVVFDVASAVVSGILALTAGYFELPPEEPLESYVYQVIEDAPSITGSGAVTESADIAAGSGSQSTTGSGAATESADTASGAGSQSLAGTGATTEGADTASGTGDQAGALAVMLQAGYYEVAPERIEAYGSTLTFVAQVAGVTGSGTPTEDPDTASGTGSSEGDAAYCVDFPDEDWSDEIQDATIAFLFEDAPDIQLPAVVPGQGGAGFVPGRRPKRPRTNVPVGPYRRVGQVFGEEYAPSPDMQPWRPAPVTQQEPAPLAVAVHDALAQAAREAKAREAELLAAADRESQRLKALEERKARSLKVSITIAHGKIY